MQLERVKISNILSFPYVEDLENDPGVSFHAGQEWVMNILIGPNGSGKSNFLEIINQIFKVGLIRDYVYHRESIQNKDIPDNQTISYQPVLLETLTPHISTPDKPSHAQITLILNQNDVDNLLFVIKYRTLLQDIIARYSTLDVNFPVVSPDDVTFVTTLHVSFSLNFADRTMTLDTAHMSDVERFMLYYIQHRELIQICMNIYNDFARKSSERKRYPLKNTFAIIGSDRANSLAFGSIDPTEKSVLIAHQNTKSDATIGYTLCMSKIVHILSTSQSSGMLMDDEAIAAVLAYHPFVQGLQALFKKYIGLEFYVTQTATWYQVVFKDTLGRALHFGMLSSGELSFVMIIFGLYWYDLENGLMIIDEPELHLHPQMQKKFMEMIDELSQHFKMQFIIATHSPVMINEKNIGHVYKFAKRDTGTVIYNPVYRWVWEDEANLVYMLKFGNVAKMFFVDKIIMVEWETDAYFFDFYIQHLRTIVPRAERIQNYEIININGKWGYRKWARFLQKFGLYTYFIGDWDNVIDTHIIEDANLLRRAQTARRKFYKPGTNHYGGTVAAIRKFYPADYDYIMEEINGMYDKGIYILKKGDLETYLNLPVKWLDETISFCRKQFAEWLVDPVTDDRRQELYQIFSSIFQDTTSGS